MLIELFVVFAMFVGSVGFGAVLRFPSVLNIRIGDGVLLLQRNTRWFALASNLICKLIR